MDTSSQIAAGLARLALFQRTRDWRRGEEFDLTPTQTQILARLVHQGPARVSRVAEEIGVRQPTATGAVTALVRKGLVERRRDPDDARATQLLPTRKGQNMARKLDEWPDAMRGAIDSLDEAQRGAFLHALTCMVGHLQERGEIPVQRMCVGCRFFEPNVHGGARPHHCNFVDAAFGDAQLRLDCDDHEPASESRTRAAFRQFRNRDEEEADTPPAPTGEVS